MKSFFLSAILFCIGGAVMAQSSSRSEQEVAAAVESFRKALIDPDKAVLDKLVTDQLTYGHSSGVVQDKAQFEEALLSRSSDFVTIDLTAQTIQVAGNTAWVRHVLSATTNDGGKPGTTKLSILLVWIKQKGEWRLFARQAVKIAA